LTLATRRGERGHHQVIRLLRKQCGDRVTTGIRRHRRIWSFLAALSRAGNRVAARLPPAATIRPAEACAPASGEIVMKRIPAVAIGVALCALATGADAQS